MEALSPISANIQMKPRTTRQKNKDMAEEDVLKIEAVKKTQKEKEYAAAPPERVIQPPINDGGLAEVFKVGSCIGKGGFAMCYQGWLRDKKEGPEKSLFALKVVKATMSQKKMEEKVHFLKIYHFNMQTDSHPVSNGTTNSCENEASQHRRVPPRVHVQREHLCRSRDVLQRVCHGHGQETEVLDPARSQEVYSTTLWGNQVHARSERTTPRLENG